ncbi:Serine/threonine protein kinase [Handroanthus impetiginosus]|uniref:Serine/threonine protein kinase n=1 Tax=Handroanthus impetiginosus TaxID=429701 RepID=A0A2G9H710_9LAMI|nr:Serine/threonine protein kinase [Handroanthus impetiginosus]
MITFCLTSANPLNIAILLLFLIPLDHSVNFQVSRFSPDVTVVVLEGDAVTSVCEIQFNSLIFACRVGQVIYNGKVPLWDSNSKILADFTTRFSFTIDTQNSSEYGDIEFDSFVNTEWDPLYEHVGINKNSLESSWVTIGVSASTGKYSECHILESWEFSSSLDIKESNKNNAKRIGLIVGIVILGCILGTSAVVAAFLVLRKHGDDVGDNNNPEAANLTSINNDLKRGAAPRRFSYKDLASATNNFSDERKLGEGGFSGVYKGYLINLDTPVAVKKISRGSKQGKKQYITEVEIINMLRHRNLVQLIGWGHDQGEFLRNQLSWTLRYKIALGLASALLYLHEEWDQCVVHRDIKSSNVMLDSSFNAKLGDFGLARLMDHELGPQMTGLAGTLGYLAPEYKGLVEWVWDLYGNGERISIVDERLQKDFQVKQAECLMIVGLWCAHPDWNMRPSIRQAIRVLSFEMELPKLPTKMLVAMYHAPNSSLVSSVEPLITSSSINAGG